MIVGQTQQASAIATLRTGQTQALTVGFLSDVPTVASVTDTGLVTPLANGVVNIYMVFGGVQGTKTIRVVPSFQGQWRGSYVVRTCSQTGFFTSVNACNDLINRVFPTTMTITQNLDAISGNFFLGAIPFTPFIGPIAGDGSVGISGTDTLGSSISETVSWRLMSPQIGRITGRQTFILRALPNGGELQADADIVDWLNKIAASDAYPLNHRRFNSWTDVLGAQRGDEKPR
jgi:hypothetical protein